MKGSIFDKVTFNNGYQMPRYGIGPNKVQNIQKDGNVAGTDLYQKKTDAITDFRRMLEVAVENGFRSFDSGARYGTEEDIGAFFRTCGLPREELFVTTKVNNKMQGYDTTLKDFDDSMNKLGLDYVDLYMIHCPVPVKGLYVETWKAIEKIYKSGRAKAIGVSNFTVQHLYNLMDQTEIVPVVNQKEQHPFYVQPNLLAFERRHNIISQSYSPLGMGKFATDPRIQWLADKHGKSIAQIILRWHVQSGFMVVTRSSAEKRIHENANIFDFELSAEDMAFMSTLNHHDRIWHDPDRFPGTYAHVHVENVFREAVDHELEAMKADDETRERVKRDVETLLDAKDVDLTRDYIIYCFTKAVAKHGPNANIEEQACEEAVSLAKDAVARFTK